MRIATRFRGGLIKLGQVASLRLDVLPREVTDELARLQDRVAAHPFAEVAAQIERELGRPPEALFAELASEPLAAASLGTRLSSGKFVCRALLPPIWLALHSAQAAQRYKGCCATLWLSRVYWVFQPQRPLVQLFRSITDWPAASPLR